MWRDSVLMVWGSSALQMRDTCKVIVLERSWNHYEHRITSSAAAAVLLCWALAVLSSSAPFALPHFTTGNLKMPLPGLTEIPRWIISELSFRNNLHLDSGTKAAPTAIKSFTPSSLIMVAHLAPLSTSLCSQEWQRTFTLLGQESFLPMETHTGTSCSHCCEHPSHSPAAKVANYGQEAQKEHFNFFFFSAN